MDTLSSTHLGACLEGCEDRAAITILRSSVDVGHVTHLLQRLAVQHQGRHIIAETYIRSPSSSSSSAAAAASSSQQVVIIIISLYHHMNSRAATTINPPEDDDLVPPFPVPLDKVLAGPELARIESIQQSL